MAHDLTRDELLPALRAWAYLAGCAEPLRESLPASLGWLRERWDAGDDHLPLDLVHDLGHLLLRGRDFRFASTRELGWWLDDERSDRLAWEDRVLGRWAMDPTVMEAHVVIAGFSAEYRDAAVAHAVGLALGRVVTLEVETVRGNPAHLRALAGSLVNGVPGDYRGWAQGVDHGWVSWALERRAALLPRLASGRLFRPEDLWEIAHLPELPSESARLALREVNGLAARVGPVSPEVARKLRHAAREVPVEAEESDQYPAGGFDAVSTKGSFENLVRSEVAYVGEGAAEHRGIDLFDVRFAENELLFYTRDESPLLDARRDSVVVIDRPAQLRYKSPGVEAQTLVMVEAAALALQADLLRLFGPAGSRTTIVWRCSDAEDRAAADEERAILALTLASEVAHGRVELAIEDEWSGTEVRGRVVVSPLAPDATVPCCAWVRLGDTCWEVDGETFDLGDAPSGLRAVVDAILLAVGLRRPRVRPA